MIPEMMATDAVVSGQNSDNVGPNPETDCDNLISIEEEDEEEEVNEYDDPDDMATDSVSQERRNLRPIAKKNYTERLNNKKAKPATAVALSEELEDSDEENGLVIDCDMSSEDKTNPDIIVDHEDSTETINRKCLRSKQDDNHEAVVANGASAEDEEFYEKLGDDENEIAIDEEEDEDGVREEEGVEVVKKKPKIAKFRMNGLKASKLKKFRRSAAAHHRLLNVAKSIQKVPPTEIVDDKKDKDEDDKVVGEGGQCPICNENFEDAHTFTVHIREHNSNSFAHTCKICSKQLSSASSLDRHMYVHSGERPFECSVCSLKFTTNGNMHRHMKIHESSPNAKAKTEKRTLKRPLSGNKSPTPVQSPKREPQSSDASAEENACDEPAAKSTESKVGDQSSLNCPVCGKYFLTPTTLKSHMFMHSNDPIKCSTCGVTSRNYANYLDHSCPQNDRDGDKLSKIGFHDLSFIEFSTPKFALIAKQVCEDQSRDPSSAFFSWECLKCAKAFPSDRALQQHEESHENGLTTCHTCKCDFSSRKSFQDHQLRHRIAETMVTKQPPDSVRNGEKSAGKEDFLALLELCDKRRVSAVKQAGSKNKKLRQLDGFGYFNQEIPQKSGDEANDKDDEMDTSRDFADISSIISLTSKTPLVPSMRTSPVTASPASPPRATVASSVPVSPVIEGSANSNFDAAVQAGSFSDSHSAKEDDEDASVDMETEGTFSCRKCSKSFSHPNDLKQHVRVHARASPLHQCNFCPYQSVDKSTLKRHLRKHNGEHPFKCSICDYVFTTKANGHRHVRNKHKLSDIEAADAVVYNPNMLESKDGDSMSSEANSTETVCKYCKQDFKYNRVLRHHLRSLNNSCSRKPYSCSLCKQGFSTKNNCIRHVTNHHPECRDKAKELVVVNETSQSTPQEQPSVQSEEASENEATVSEPLNLSVSTESRDCSQSADCSSEGFAGSDAEIVSVAESLVSLSEVMPPQDQPLDLTICALNLSLKAPENPPPQSVATGTVTITEVDCCETPNASDDANAETPTASRKECPPKSAPPASHQTSPVNLTNVPKPLDLAKSSSSTPLCLVSEASTNPTSLVVCLPKVVSPPQVNGIVSGKSTVPVVFATPPVVTSLPPSVPTESGAYVDSSKPGQRVKRFSCEICFKGFTLKSNRERHIKNHHPEHARPPRSRNYIPTLSSAPSVPKPGGSPLSEKTRDALRFTLISKSSNSGVNKSPGKTNSGAQTNLATPVRLLIAADRINHPDSFPESSSRNKNDATDLASVSSVIDTVNCQAFKQYLIEAKELPGNHIDGRALASTDADVSPLPVVDSSRSGEDPSPSEGRKSSYAKCAKSIQCSYCKRKFPWKSSLSRHLLTHTGLKPHKCPKCPLSFTTKSNRDRHLYRQHGNSDEVSTAVGEKPFKCSVCSGFFSTRGKLKKHYYLKHSTSGSDDAAGYSKTENATAKGKGRDESPSSRNSSRNHRAVDEFDGSGARVSEEDEDDDESGALSDDASDSLDCHVCGGVFKSQAGLLGHLKEAHPLTVSDSPECSSPEKSTNQKIVVPVIKVEPVDPEEENDSSSSSKQASEQPAAHPCRQCTLTFNTTHELQSHAKVHQKHTASQGSTANGNKSSVENGFSLPKIPVGLPKKTPNSLLYLFAAAQHARSVDSAMEAQEGSVATVAATGTKKSRAATSSASNTTAEATTASRADRNETGTDGDDNSLILNLLGLKDPEFLDEMLDSAVRSRVKKEPVEA